MTEEQQDNGGSHGHIKPVGKDRKILTLDLKAFCFLKFTVAVIWGMDWLGKKQEEQD